MIDHPMIRVEKPSLLAFPAEIGESSFFGARKSDE